MLQDLEKETRILKEKLESIEKYIQEQKESTNMFGRSYSKVGSSNSDFLIKTRGQVKILWGNKFIDLIKDGKVNAELKFIFHEDEVGVKDGIYVVDKNGKQDVILSIGGELITLKDGTGTTYVSFMEKLKTNPDLKLLALKNIGFIYDSLESIDADSLKNGIIYVESTQKLYTIKDGVLAELIFSGGIPNPYTEQFVIAKNDNNKGALLIKGEGINNSLAFDSCYIYTEGKDSIIDSEGNIKFNIGGLEKILINDSLVIFNLNAVSDMFQSVIADSKTGFRLYYKGGESTLEVDNLIVRKYSNLDKESSVTLRNTYWTYSNNIIDTVECKSSAEENTFKYEISLIYKNEFKNNEYIYSYINLPKTIENDRSYTLLGLLTFKVIIEDITYSLLNNKIIIELCKNKVDPEIIEEIDPLKLEPLLLKQILFLVNTDKNIYIPRVGKVGFDVIKSEPFNGSISKEDEEKLKIKVVEDRVGDLTNLKLLGKEKKEGVEKEVPIKDIGIYSVNGAFLKALYVKDYKLPIKDNSTKLVSTEWIHKLLPKGTIIMFNGDIIPEGWHICDGTEGTPNLVGKFIKASGKGISIGDNETDLDVNNKYSLKRENIPNHTHPHIHNYTIGSISGYTNPTNLGEVSSDSTYLWIHTPILTSVLASADLTENAPGKDEPIGTTYNLTTTSVDVMQDLDTTYNYVTTNLGEHSHSFTICDNTLKSTSNVINSTKDENSLPETAVPIKFEPHAYAILFIMKLI